MNNSEKHHEASLLLERLAESVKEGAQRIHVPSYSRDEVMAAIHDIAEKKDLNIVHIDHRSDMLEITFEKKSAYHNQHE